MVSSQRTPFLALIAVGAVMASACAAPAASPTTAPKPTQAAPSTAASPAVAAASPAAVAPGTSPAGSPAVAASPAASPAIASSPAAAAAAPAGAVQKVNANTATVPQLQAAFEANGIPSAARWAREVEEYRPYPADDPNWGKLRRELAKYNPAPDVLEKIIASLTL